MSALNNSQKRAILFSFLDIHKRMAEVEVLLARDADASPFAQCLPDLSPAESAEVRNNFARLRQAMVENLAALGIPLDVRRTSLRWTLQCTMVFIGNAISDLNADRLRGYGAVDPAARERVGQTQQELQRLVEQIAASAAPAVDGPPAPG
jgi:hypothetical protein